MEHKKVSHFGDDTCSCGWDGWPCPDYEAEQIEALAQSKPEPSPHEEMMELLGAIFVQLSRIYDAQMLMLPADAREAMDIMHSNGELMGSPPTLKEDAWE